jgi:YVTN family beta-propeller protein
MEARAWTRIVMALGLALLLAAGDLGTATAQGNRKEVQPKQAIRNADPSLLPVVSPGTDFTYRISLKQGRTFNAGNGDGIQVTRARGNIAVDAMRRVSATVYEVDFSSADTGEAGSATLSINFTNQKGKLKFVSAAVTVALPGGTEVVTVSTLDKTILQRVGVGSQPLGIDTAGTPQINFLSAFVANSLGNTVSVVDLPTNTLVANVTVGVRPSFVAVAGIFGAQFAYVTNSGGDTVSVINVQNLSVIATIPVGDNPQGIAFVGQQGVRELAYVANQDSDNVSVIDTISNTVIQTIPVGDGPVGVAVAGQLGAQVVAVTLANEDRVALIDSNSNTVLARVAVGDQPVFARVSGAQFNEIFVVNQGGDSLSIVDLISQSETARIPVGLLPTGAAVAGPANAEEVYVANRGDGTISVVSVPDRRTIRTIPVGGRPRMAVTIGVVGSQNVLVTN